MRVGMSATETRSKIIGPAIGVDAPRHHTQQLVADGLAVCVDDGFEPLEIHMKYEGLIAKRGHHRDSTFQSGQERRAVRQSGERIKHASLGMRVRGRRTVECPDDELGQVLQQVDLPGAEAVRPVRDHLQNPVTDSPAHEGDDRNRPRAGTAARFAVHSFIGLAVVANQNRAGPRGLAGQSAHHHQSGSFGTGQRTGGDRADQFVALRQLHDGTRRACCTARLFRHGSHHGARGHIRLGDGLLNLPDGPQGFRIRAHAVNRKSWE